MKLSSTRFIWETLVFLSILIVLLAGCMGASKTDVGSGTMAIFQGKGVQIENQNMNPSKDIFPPSVTGIIKNISNFRISSVDVKIIFYDNNGISLGTAIVNVYNLTPGKAKDFTAYFFGSAISAKKVSSYNIEIADVVAGE